MAAPSFCSTSRDLTCRSYKPKSIVEKRGLTSGLGIPAPSRLARPLCSPSTEGHSRRAVVAQSKRRKGSDSGFRFEKRRGVYHLQYNDYEADVREEEAWKVAVPLLGGLVLSAALIGPLIVGVAFTAVAVGAALSAGALFTSLFLPFFIFIGMGSLFFMGATFASVATLGVGLLLPKIIGLAVAVGGLGVGAMAVSLFLKPAAEGAKDRYNGASDGKAKGKGKLRAEDEGELIIDVDPEIDRQLREFDDLLADRESQRRRTDQFRRRG